MPSEQNPERCTDCNDTGTTLQTERPCSCQYADPFPVTVTPRCLEIERRADEATVDEADDAYHIGVRDGFSEAVQLIDRLSGGDGEYRFCTNADPERHCPDPAAMIRNIVQRLNTTGGSQ